MREADTLGAVLDDVADMVMRAQAVARSERAREAEGLAAAAAEASGVAARMARLAAEVGRGSA